MKKVTLFFLALLCTYLSFGQSRQQLDYLFGNLNASEVPSGYLAPYGMDMADKEDFNGIISDSNVVNSLDIVRLLYADIYSARFYNQAPAMADMDALNNAITGAADNSIVLFYGKFSIFREDALDQNLLQYTNGQLYDVAGRTESPYVLQSTFAAYPRRHSFNNGTVTLQFDPSLFFTNTGSSVQSLQADFGGGYQTISANGSTGYTYTDSTGVHLITIKTEFSDGSTQYTHIAVWVTLASSGGSSTARYVRADLNTPEIDIPEVPGVHSGARVYIIRSIHTPANQILKPLIVAEGLDISSTAPQFQDNYNVNDLIDEWNSVTFGPASQTFTDFLDDIAQYDLVFVDWGNGTDDIVRNAILLEDIIGRINTMKANSGSGQQNVVMGISMGGLVTRYCLASMTKRGVNPQTRLLITHDSPHQGAYVPMAFQHLTLGLQNVDILGVRLGGVMSGSLDQAVNLLQSPAAQQQLVMVATDGGGGAAQNTFLSTTYRNMITFDAGDPQPAYQFIATAQGSQCGISPLTEGAALVTGNASGNASGLVAWATRGIISHWKYSVEIDARGLIGSANHQILHFQIRRLQRLFFGIINNNHIIALINRDEPGFDNIPWESVPGGTQSLGARLNIGSNNLSGNWSLIGQWFLGLNYNFTLADQWGFTPVFSVLDVTSAVSLSMIHNSYLRGITPAGVSRAVDYIAQESFSGAGGTSQFNREHTAFTPRNAEWIYNTMEGLAFNDCSGTCGDGYTIAGNDKVCSSEVYTVNNVPPGSTVTWSASPQGMVSIPNPNGTQVTVNQVGNGNFTLVATVTNPCNQTATASKFIQSGGSGWQMQIYGPTYVSCGQTVSFQVANIAGGAYNWNFPSGWSYMYGQGTPVLYVQVPYYYGSSGDVSVTIYDGCNYFNSSLYVETSCDGYYSISPNPASSTFTVAAKEYNAKGEKLNKSITEVIIYDQLGTVKKRLTFNKVKSTTLSVGGLSKGTYFVEITDGKNKERHQLLIKY